MSPCHLCRIRVTVDRVHRATVYATEPLNLHVRRCLDEGLSLEGAFQRNWLVKAFYEVTEGDGRAVLDTELSATRERLMSAHPKPPRAGLKQLFMANCSMLETCARNNVRVHFVRRLTAHMRRLVEQPSGRRQGKSDSYRGPIHAATAPV